MIVSVLVTGPQGCGKTTLINRIVEALSDIPFRLEFFADEDDDEIRAEREAWEIANPNGVIITEAQ